MYKKILILLYIITVSIPKLLTGGHHHSSPPPIFNNTYTHVNQLPIPSFPTPPIFSTNSINPTGYLQYSYNGDTFPVAYYEQNGNTFFFNLKNGMLLKIKGSTTIYGVTFNTEWDYNPLIRDTQTSSHLAIVIQTSSQPLVTPKSQTNRVPLVLIWAHNKGRDELDNSNGFSLSVNPADAMFSENSATDYIPGISFENAQIYFGKIIKNVYLTQSPLSIQNKMIGGTFIARPISQSELSVLRAGYNQSFPGTFVIASQEDNFTPISSSETNSQIEE